MRCAAKFYQPRIFGFLVFLPLMLAVFGPARAEIVHQDSLTDTQHEHAWPINYRHNFTANRDLRVTDIFLRLSETRTSSYASVPSMSIEFNGSTFSYISLNFADGVLHFRGEAQVLNGVAGTMTVNCGCASGEVYIS